MEMHELVAFAKLQDERFSVLDEGKSTPRERIYAQAVKLGEEFGELCDAILAHANAQRQEKMDNMEEDALPKELADVAITLFILAARLNIDLPAVIEKKVAVVNERFRDVSV